MSKLAHIFFEHDLRAGHMGLALALKKKKINLKDDYAIFVNRRWTALKMIAPGNVVLHLRQPNNRPIDPTAIKYLPGCVRGGDLDYSKALGKAIDKRFENRRHYMN